MHYFNSTELRKLLEYTYNHDRRAHSAFLMGVVHGLRVSELLAVRREDFQGERIVIRRLKGGKNSLQKINISDNPVWDERQVQQYLPLNIRRQSLDLMIKKYGEKCGIARAKLHFHTLRHTCAHIIFEESKNLSRVQQVLGHRSPATSLIYLAESQESAGVEDLQAGLEKYSKS